MSVSVSVSSGAAKDCGTLSSVDVGGVSRNRENEEDRPMWHETVCSVTHRVACMFATDKVRNLKPIR